MAFDEPSPRAPAEPVDVLIRLVDEDGCWRLECSPVFETMMFHSGRVAEAAGRSLAARLAFAGRGVQMAIEDRRHVIMGTQTYFPLPCADATLQSGARP